jgi:hypothetical protein
MDTLVLAVAVVLAVVLVASLIRSTLRWRGGWRAAALLVAIAIAAWLAKLVVDLRSDPTSHNLWPMEGAAVMFLALLVLGVCAASRANTLAKSPRS